MSLGTIVLIVVTLLSIGVIAWSHRSGGLGLAVFALPVLLLTGRL